MLDIVSIIVTALMVVYVARSNKKMDKVNTKVEEYHKAVNGNMEKLLKTTAELATAKEKKKGDDALIIEKAKTEEQKKA